MSDAYDPAAIESRWQAQWEADGLYRSEVDWSRPKHYALTMLPYPSGDLHIGHWFAMAPSDARARWMRMRGYNVLFPMGFDAFGLPAENAAITRNIHPKVWTEANIERMRRQLRSMGAMFDWRREIVSCEPSYYKWTQWFFKTFFEHDLAYRGEAIVNWSETLQTVLANEQVIDGKDERTGQPVIQKLMSQWFFRITRYADELLEFDGIDWPDSIKASQTNWINRSEGARVDFGTDHGPITVYTTRPDTLFGATFMVLAPEHPLVAALTTEQQREAVDAYVAEAARASELERTQESGDKTGVFTGSYAINPVNGARVPVWIADYVLMSYGTGAIMAVPAHDQRDFDFARRFGIDVVPVIQPEGERLDGATMTEAYAGPGVMINSGEFDGTESSEAKGRANPAIAAMIDWLEARGIGEQAVNYRLRDWLISRQRYWGAPIPMLRRADGSYEAERDENLPVLLPEDVQFKPTGESPLKYHDSFRHAVDSDGNPAERETDTMDTFMCSSWYPWRYLSPDYPDAAFDPEEAAYWYPVDVYTGGAEHAVMHLLYVRFFNKAMRDTGCFEPTAEAMRRHGRDPDGLFDEPMLALRNQGQILGEERPGDILAISGVRDGNRWIASRVEVVSDAGQLPAGAVFAGELMRRTENVLQVQADDGLQTVEVPKDAVVEVPHIPGDNDVNQLRHHLEVERMSKTRGNVVNPDELVERYGADTVRAFLMFNFDWQRGGPWDSRKIVGVTRWLNDIWDLVLAGPAAGDAADRELQRAVHQATARITDSMEVFSFNTAVAALMALRNSLKEAARSGVSRAVWDDCVSRLLRLMAPITPHVAEELWQRTGGAGSVHEAAWPEADPELARADSVTLVIMIGGKVRGRLEVDADISQDEAERLALESEVAQRALDGGTPRRVVFIKPRGNDGPKVNIVV